MKQAEGGMMFESKNREELRSEFRQLCLIHHPDKGGDHHVFIQIQEAYERALKNIDTPEWDRSAVNDWEAFKAFEELLEGLKVYGFTLELIGNWLWLQVDFEAENYKELISYLKEHNWKFSGAKKRWYWFNGIGSAKKKIRGSKSWNKIRKTYGVAGKIENEEEKTYKLQKVKG